MTTPKLILSIFPVPWVRHRLGGAGVVAVDVSRGSGCTMIIVAGNAHNENVTGPGHRGIDNHEQLSWG